MKFLRILFTLAALLAGLPAIAQTGIADLVVARKVNLQGYATPAALAADVNDYAPAGMSNATFLRLSSSAAVNISGIAGGTHGRVLWLINVGTFNITLLAESSLSVAANRFAIQGATVIAPGSAVSFWYDGATQIRWMGLVQGKATTSWGGIGGNLADQTDLNDQLALASQAALTTGVVDESDTVLFSAPNPTTLHIAALAHGVFAPLLGTGLPAPAAFKSFPAQDYPLASLGLSADGTYARWVGYNSAGTVVTSTTPYVDDDTIIQLGAIVLKRVGGLTTFIDDGGPRSFATIPSMAGFSELERTYLKYASTVTVTNASNNMTLARAAGIIKGMSLNWTALGNKNSLDQAAVSPAPFTQVNPATAAGTSLPAAVTVLTATNYWNGAASVALAANGNASVKRLMLGVKGGLFVQEGEFQYTNLDAAVSNFATAPFTTLLAQDLFIEIGRLAVVKNASDLSNPNQARFFVTGTGAGGSQGGAPSAVTSINGTAGEVSVSSPVGAVVISLPGTLIFTSKIITGGTFNSPILTTPDLGTPASGVMTNVTGTALNLTAGKVVTNAALTGDVTSNGTTNATTLATVTGTTGSFGSATLIPIVTVNAKGLVTNVTTIAVGGGTGAAAGTLTGTTLAANVVNASLNSISPTGGTLSVAGAISASATNATHVLGGTNSAGLIAQINNANATGYGLRIQNGNDANYALGIINAANSAVNIQLLGNGNASFAGAVSVGSGLSVTGALGVTSNIIANGTVSAAAGGVVLAGSSANPYVQLTDTGGASYLEVSGGNLRLVPRAGQTAAITASLAVTGGISATNTISINAPVNIGFAVSDGTRSGLFATSSAGGIVVGSTNNVPLFLASNGSVIGTVTTTGFAVAGAITSSVAVSNYTTISSTGSLDAAIKSSTGGNDVYFGQLPGSGGALNTFSVYIGGERVRVTTAGLSVTGTINATGIINFGANGALIGPPTATTRSVGTRLVLYSNVGPGDVDFGMGIESNAVWTSTASGGSIKFYSGPNVIGAWNAAGLAVTGNLSATGTINGTHSGSFTGGGSFSGNVTGTVTGTVNSSTAIISDIGSGGSIQFKQSGSNSGVITGSSGAMTIDTQAGGQFNVLIGGLNHLFMTATATTITGNLQVSGSLTKGSGTFTIPHPLASLNKTTNLVHSFIEGPRADLIYRGRVALANGKATVDIDKAVGMTSGTFVALTENPQVWLQNETNGYSVRGKVAGATLTLEGSGSDSVSWMVIAERHDAVIKAASFTDKDGKVILEPRKDAPAKKLEAAASPK